MKNIIVMVFVCILLFHMNVFGQEATNDEVKLAWTPNTENDLAGYKVYHGPSSGTYDNIVDVGLPPVGVGVSDVIVVIGIPPQNRYIVVTAYDTFGNESGYSDEVVVVDSVSIPQGFRQVSIKKTVNSVTTTNTVTETIYNP